MEKLENIFLLFIAFIMSAYTYETYTMILDDNKMTELELKTLLGSWVPKTDVINPVKVLKSSSKLKIKVGLDKKINIKILNDNGSPVYLRQFAPHKPKEMRVDISNWSSGDYNIVFAASGGENFLKGEFTIN